MYIVVREVLSARANRVGDQCDQMFGVLVLYLAIYKNENLLIALKIYKSKWKYLPNTK